MSRPNFFIVGAPRCGTTALYQYLRAHRNIFMPRAKEPHYFAEDFPRFRTIDSLERYLALFSSRRGEHAAVGEASVWYAYSAVAIEKIRAFEARAKIILMVRNPVDLVYSLHAQHLYNFDEDEPDFQKAWHLQTDRAKEGGGLRIPAMCRDPAFLQYARVGRLGEQAERILARFPAEQVKIIVFEDFQDSPRAVYEQVLAFLEVPPDGRTDFPRFNESQQHRVVWFGRILRSAPAPVRRIVEGVKRATGIADLGIASALRRLNRRTTNREPLAPALRSDLADGFRADVRKLAAILGRDLSHWTSP